MYQSTKQISGGVTAAYRQYTDEPVEVVVLAGLGAVMAEWSPVAKRLAERYSVLLYDRAGIGGSSASDAPRTPEQIARELHALLEQIPHRERVILLAHSQGGLYARQYCLLYPNEVRALLLLDPLTPDDNTFKERFTPDEFKKSGVDKFANLRAAHTLAKLRLGAVIKAMMRKAPPLYYYPFDSESEEAILSSLTKPLLYQTMQDEYRYAHEEALLVPLRNDSAAEDIPLALITHGSAPAMKETMEFGGADEATARKVEELWQELMQRYMTRHRNAKLFRAEESTHYLHLTQPELIEEALAWALTVPR